MIENVNGTLPASNVLFPLNATSGNIDNPNKTGDVKEVKADDMVTLSTKKTESTQSSPPCEERSEIENEEAVQQAEETARQAEEAARQASEAPRNEQVGTRVDILT